MPVNKVEGVRVCLQDIETNSHNGPEEVEQSEQEY